MSRRRSLTRRKWLQNAGLLGAAAPLVLPSAVSALEVRQTPEQQQPALGPREPSPGLPARLFSFDPSLYRFTPDEDAFLEEVGQTTFQYFWEQANPKTGQVEDRGPAEGGALRNASSVAATGFGLTALCIAANRGWQEEQAARDRAKLTLNFALKTVQNQHGFMYHFVNGDTGQRILQSEVSPIDTGLFLCGALTCRGYFDDQEIKQLATEL